MTAFTPRELAERKLEMGDFFPYDASDAWWASTDAEKGASLPPPKDAAHRAARGIIRDLTDRRGIKEGFRQVEESTRVDLIEALAEIIRAAYEVPAGQPYAELLQELEDHATAYEVPAGLVARAADALRCGVCAFSPEDIKRMVGWWQGREAFDVMGKPDPIEDPLDAALLKRLKDRVGS